MNETSAYLDNLQYFKGIREVDQMTPLERAKALANGEAVDRMPISIMADLTTPSMIGSTLRQCDETPRGKADVQIAIYKMFGVDGIGLFYGLNSLAIQLGGGCTTSEHMNPSLTTPAITDLDDIAKLDLDQIEMRKDPFAWKAFDALKIMREEVGDEVGLAMNFTSPFTVASGIVGVERFLVGLVKDTERMEQLLQFTTDALYKLAEPFIQEGFEICTSDPVASPTVINPKLYRKFAQPFERQFAERIEAKQGTPLHFHMCGNSTKILEDIADVGYKAYSLDNMVDLAVAKEKIGDRLQIEGNVDPVKDMLEGTPESIEEAVKNCYRKAWDSPKGFVVHSGCDMPYGTPRENIYAYLKAAKECAADQAKGLRKPQDHYIWEE